MKFCAKCGGTGILVNGEVCECSKTMPDFYSDSACFDIPEQYRDLVFTEELVPDMWSGSYKKFLSKLHTDISTMAVTSRNWLICSPPKHAKTVFAYTTMKRLFRAGIGVCPLNDIMELKKVISEYSVEDDIDLFKVPYLFVRIPVFLTSEVFELCTTLLDRRVRKSLSTIFLFNGSWERLRAADVYCSFTPYKGDGSYCTFSVNSWREVNEK